MTKHIQTILRQQPTNCVSVFDHSVGLALKGLMYKSIFAILSKLCHGCLIRSCVRWLYSPYIFIDRIRKFRSIAREICKSSDKSEEQRKSMAKSVMLENRFGQCILRLPKDNQGTSSKSNGKLEAILFSVAGFLCLLVIVFIVINLRRSKKRSLICLKEKLQREDRLISDTMRISKLFF